MAVEISIKVYNPSPYSDLSQSLQSDQFFTFCNDYYDLIMIDSPVNDDLLDRVRKKLNISGNIETNLDESHLLNYLIFDCSCIASHPKVSSVILKNHGIEITPVQYIEGWEYHRFVCINKKDVKIILAKLKEQFEFEILRINDDEIYGLMRMTGLSTSDLLDSLTASQTSLLLDAYKEGYYEIPRKVKLAEIADKYGISRHAIEKRLRRGENSIMDKVLPMIDFKTHSKETRVAPS